MSWTPYVTVTSLYLWCGLIGDHYAGYETQANAYWFTGDAVSNNHFMYMQATLLKAGDVAMGVSHWAQYRQKQRIHPIGPTGSVPPQSPYCHHAPVLHYVKSRFFPIVGNRQGMLQGDLIGTKAALSPLTCLYPFARYSPRRNRARESKLRTMNAPT